MAIYKNSPPIVTNGLVIALDADNVKSYSGSGTVWTDLSGNNFNATMSGSVPYVAYTLPPYFSYSGNNSYDFQSSSNLTSSIVSELTITSVATITNLSQRSSLFQKYQATGIPGYIFEVGTVSGLWTNTMRYYCEGFPLGGACDYRGSVQLTPNIPYVFTVTYSRTTNTVTMYYNNLVMPATQAGGNSPNVNWSQGTNTYVIGSQRPSSNTIPSYMSQYNVLVYNRALSSIEVRQNYNALKSRFGLS
jgi:hypothetical protein